MRAALVSSACLALLALASPAQAAQRFADPESSGPEPCLESAPCSLKQAVDNAKSNDEVIVGSGIYILSSTDVEVAPAKTGVYVHGDFSGPRPTIVGAYPGSAMVGMFGPDGRLAYLDVTNNSNGGTVACYGGVTVERMKVAVKGTGATALSQGDTCLVRDSVIRAEGESTVAISAFGLFGGSSAGAIRNVTAIATGPKTVALQAEGSFVPAAAYTSNVRNSILSGDLYDVQSIMGGAGSSNATVAYSNFDVAKQEAGTLIALGSGNQSAPPQFVNAAAGDYREAPGSPTIDAGADEKLGPEDFDGNPRFLGSAPDIGAFEFVQPPQAPAPAALAAAGEIRSLSIAPQAFRAPNAGAAVLSAARKRKAPLATVVSYDLSGAAIVAFSVERKLSGRKVGAACVRKTEANTGRRKCPLYKPVKGGFSHSGVAGLNTFKFSGRLSQALAPGAYRLTGKTAASSRTANFRIVK
jgi:hypothetical protein